MLNIFRQVRGKINIIMSVSADIFTARLVSLKFMHFILRRIKESKLNVLVVSCPIWQFQITLGFHHSLHLENGLEEHFNE